MREVECIVDKVIIEVLPEKKLEQRCEWDEWENQMKSWV